MADSDRKFVLFWDIIRGETRYRWRLRGPNGETLEWAEQGYTSKPECEGSIESAKLKYPDVPVEDLTVARG